MLLFSFVLQARDDEFWIDERQRHGESVVSFSPMGDVRSSRAENGTNGLELMNGG